MARSIELRRHTENDGDTLTAEGVEAALALGAALHGGYQVVVSSGAQRATQAAACMIAGLGESIPGGVVVEPGLRSSLEDEWRAAYQAAGAGDLQSLLDADPALVHADSALLAQGLRHVFERLGNGQRALAIGHSPTNEAAVFGLTGIMIVPMSKGDGVVVIDTGEGFELDAVD